VSERSIIHPPHLQGAKAAFRELVAAFGGQVPASVETGKCQSRISAYGHRNTTDFPPLDVVDALEERTHGLPGHPHVTRWLARRRGCELVRLPDPAMPETVWSSMVSRLAKEAGELMSGVCHDLGSENDISPAEARGRLVDAADLVRVAVEIEAALKQRAALEGPGGGSGG
jgi:hypothetical protein